MAAETFFGKLANDVLEATEHIATRMEEGISVLTTGDLPNAGERGNAQLTNLDEFDLDSLSEEEIQRLLSQEIMENSPLSGIADSVIGDIVAGQIGPSTPLEHFHAFRSAIRWTEPFVLCLLGFQIFMFLACLWASRKDRGITPRIIILVAIGVLVRSAERLNTLAAQNWDSIATQNYFDRRGIFVGIMLCAPLLLDCMVMLFMFLKEASQLLVQVKKQEMAQKKKSQEGTRPGGKNRAAKTRKEE
mmetsp:Transcript_50139/g.76243  ORF Transcript_50139/g.76243 Transcript_50139/m.76243 type:complete len:246 (-) Transcript_50139:194-931(-)|eukprot:CAMPEP_0117035844 /NCGR_PEP_ID=MMETSP0472-20121206/25437_1 /TAXON_ID=693140 ORGANISM="Tiarina fusus, Strain LIS" /NCGR_SAMPLE_ID=MMETSP0472 /ASSEMBLY_ACC=CAM_ASM_000603 /LENGTH=245 /DNA_ID=CAMNT_0004745445 /DNA_START=79 /DNA_END=816 /DNA_ORIENTATION=+